MPVCFDIGGPTPSNKKEEEEVMYERFPSTFHVSFLRKSITTGHILLFPKGLKQMEVVGSSEAIEKGTLKRRNPCDTLVLNTSCGCCVPNR